MSGTSNVKFESNTRSYGEVDTRLTITIELQESNHPTLAVTTAEIYSSTSATFAKHISIKFNGDLSAIDIKKVFIGDRYTQLTIENYFTYSSSILTGSLSDSDYSRFYYGSILHDGYVIIEDQGLEYKLPFKLTRTN